MLRNPRSRAYCVALVLFLAAVGLILYKVGHLGCAVAAVKPEQGWYVKLAMTFKARGGEVSIRVTLPPLSNERQEVKHERETSGILKHAVYTVPQGRIGRWYGKRVRGSQGITYSFLARTYDRKFPLKEGLQIPRTYPEDLTRYLAPTTLIQSDDPFIRAKAAEITAGARDLKETTLKLYNFVLADIRYKKLGGVTDALTALRLSEASCNGKSRAFVALCRSLKIPARMVKGLLLEIGKKRATHAWAEAWMGGQWIPFCTTNGYFARIPAKYLVLYKGDTRFITHTRSINFQWFWTIRRRLSNREDAVVSNVDQPLNPLRAWRSMKGAGVSLELLAMILMIPAGATVVAFLRSMIGLNTLGTFMPVLIAVAFRDTGLGWGVVLLCSVVVVGVGVRALLQNFHLLHVPRLAAILTVVIMTILGISLLAMKEGNPRAAAVGMFPLVIMTMTVERVCVNLLEEGLFPTLRRYLVTVGVASIAFVVMNNFVLQSFVVAFPETLLIFIALNILMGTYSGLRLLELYRFRSLLVKGGAAA